MARRRLADSRVIVTGASQGIGRALSVSAARRGAKVLAVARTESLLRELATEMREQGKKIETVTADVTRPEDREAIVRAALDRFGGADILINNAGVGATGHFVDAGPERLRQIMEVNFFGVVETTRLFLPVLRQGHAPAVVNISSILGKRGFPARSEYSASKFALQGFSEAIRAEFARFGIDVLVISPGLTQTNFSQNMIEQKALLQLDHFRGMSAESVAESTMMALERGKTDVCLTSQGKLLVMLNRFFPRLLDRLMARRVKRLFAGEINPAPGDPHVDLAVGSSHLKTRVSTS